MELNNSFGLAKFLLKLFYSLQAFHTSFIWCFFFLLKSKGQQVSSGPQDSSKYSRLFQHHYSLNGLYSDLNFPQSFFQETVPRAPIIICSITVTFVFHSFFSSLKIIDDRWKGGKSNICFFNVLVTLLFFHSVKSDFKPDCPKFHPHCVESCFGYMVKKWFYRELTVSYLKSPVESVS